jgi:hypothetical protein
LPRLSFSLSVCSLGTTRLPKCGFSWIWNLSIFRKYVEKIQVSLTSDKNNGYLILRHMNFMIICHCILLRMRIVSEKKGTEELKLNFMFRSFCLKIVTFMR